VCLVAPLCLGIYRENERSASPRPVDLDRPFENYAYANVQISPPLHTKIIRGESMRILAISFVINDPYIFHIYRLSHHKRSPYV
jgi:hypothetical protein